MKKNRNTVLGLVFAFLASTPLFAQDPPKDDRAEKQSASGSGNGGTVVVCFKKQEMYEQVKARILANYKSGVPDLNEDPLAGGAIEDIIPEKVELFDLYLRERQDGAELIANEGTRKEITDRRLELVDEKSDLHSWIMDAKSD